MSGPPAASKPPVTAIPVGLPLTLVGITLLSAEEAYCFLVVDVLRTIDDLDDFLQSTNRVLTKQNMPDHFFEAAVLWIPVTSDFNQNFVVRHRTPSGPGCRLRDFRSTSPEAFIRSPGAFNKLAKHRFYLHNSGIHASKPSHRF